MDSREATAFEQQLWTKFARQLNGCDKAISDLRRMLELPLIAIIVG
jgi:hypothetical protein